MRFNFFEPLTQFNGLFMKTTSFLCLFGTMTINKAVLPDETDIFALHFTIQFHYLKPKGFDVLIDEVLLLNVFLSGGCVNFFRFPDV